MFGTGAVTDLRTISMIVQIRTVSGADQDREWSAVGRSGYPFSF